MTPARPAPRLRSPLARIALSVALLVGAACGGVAARPGPVAVDEPAVADTTPTETEGLPRARLQPVEAPDRKPWLPVGVRWSPSAPEEGQALALALLQPPAGRAPVEAEASLGDRPVPLARTSEGWFGVAPLPIGESGPTELLLRFRLGPDSTVVQRTTVRVRAHDFPATRLSVAPGYSDPSPEALRRIREDRRRITAALARVSPRWLPRGPFERPRAGRVTSPFGQRRIFNGELRSRHTGLDISGRRGDPVRAAARGRVALTGHFYFAGNAVFLDHGLGVYTAYFHLSEIGVLEGEVVERGDLLGEVGATGRVTASHLHWGLYVAGLPLDASSLLRMDPVWEALPSP